MYNGLAWITVSGGGGTDPASYSLDTEITNDNLNGGQTYGFRVRAHNIHGWGLRSDELNEIASGLPEQPDPIIVQIVNLNVVFTWSEPVYNYAAIT